MCIVSSDVETVGRVRNVKLVEQSPQAVIVEYLQVITGGFRHVNGVEGVEFDIEPLRQGDLSVVPVYDEDGKRVLEEVFNLVSRSESETTQRLPKQKKSSCFL